MKEDKNVLGMTLEEAGEYLDHHGVKGMKWGVRRYQPYSSNKELKKRIDSGEDLEFPKNTKLYRVTHNPNEEEGKRIYASPSTSDINTYFSDMVVDSSSKRYLIEYKTKNNLKIAGTKQAMKLLNKEFGTSFDPDDLVTSILLNETNDSEIADVFMKDSDKQDRAKKCFINAGYDGMVDLVDVGIGASECPCIIFNNKTLNKERAIDEDRYYFEGLKHGESDINTNYSALDEMNEYLEHHGILGQKWGIRRSPAQLGHRSAKKQAKQEAKAAAKARKAEIKKSRAHTSASKLTDAELQQRIKRLRDEETYNNLKNSTSTVSAGKKIVGDIATNTVKDLGGQAAKYYGAKLMNAGISKIDPKLDGALKTMGFDTSNTGPIKPHNGSDTKLDKETVKKIKKLIDDMDD